MLGIGGKPHAFYLYQHRMVINNLPHHPVFVGKFYHYFVANFKFHKEW